MLERTEAIRWLREENEAALNDLYFRADAVRRNSVGDAVHFRGLIEISNICVRYCHYCGIRAPNSLVTRYRMPADEIIECVRQAKAFGYGTVVIQAGEDPGITKDWMTAIIRRIKAETGLAVTLSLGERTDDELIAWRNAGADRYLLRFETSNKALFRAIHPPRDGAEPLDRVELLKKMRALGYEIGSGVMIGIPGQSYDDLANDLMQFQTLDLDMIGVGPYIPHPETPMGQGSDLPASSNDQVPNTELMTYKVVALTRLACPRSNIPSTTALATLNLATGREKGLQRGANILMPNVTPSKYRAFYEIYPDKACIQDTAEKCNHCMRMRIESIGRRVGEGAGSAIRKKGGEEEKL